MTVIPLVGTWIEINKSLQADSMVLSFPLWERGLKYYTMLEV